jgi:hypothetical protein
LYSQTNFQIRGVLTGKSEVIYDDSTMNESVSRCGTADSESGSFRIENISRYGADGSAGKLSQRFLFKIVSARKTPPKQKAFRTPFV